MSVNEPHTKTPRRTRASMMRCAENMGVAPNATPRHPQAVLVKDSIAEHSDTTIQKPMLKWVGGKTQILDKLLAEFPTDMNNYREIFLGGGSVLLGLLTYVRLGIIRLRGCVYAYDLNEPLISMYKNIQSNHNELYSHLSSIIAEYNSCDDYALNRNPKNAEEARTKKENYYYWTRNRYNQLSPDGKNSAIGSAILIFLNKTCFRGVFRIGPRGFNVPYGNYTNPKIIDKKHLDEIHELIQGVVFKCSDFSVSLGEVESDDYVYLDPPYAPESENSFVGYTKCGFGIDSHAALFEQVHKLAASNKIMMSNADVPLVRDKFADERYTLLPVLCKRSINAKNPESKSKEVIIKNY